MALGPDLTARSGARGEAAPRLAVGAAPCGESRALIFTGRARSDRAMSRRAAPRSASCHALNPASANTCSPEPQVWT